METEEMNVEETNPLEDKTRYVYSDTALLGPNDISQADAVKKYLMINLLHKLMGHLLLRPNEIHCYRLQTTTTEDSSDPEVNWRYTATLEVWE